MTTPEEFNKRRGNRSQPEQDVLLMLHEIARAWKSGARALAYASLFQIGRLIDAKEKDGSITRKQLDTIREMVRVTTRFNGIGVDDWLDRSLVQLREPPPCERDFVQKLYEQSWGEIERGEHHLGIWGFRTGQEITHAVEGFEHSNTLMCLGEMAWLLIEGGAENRVLELALDKLGCSRCF